MVEALAFPSDGVSVFELTDAVAARQRRATFRVLERAFDAGEKPHSLLPMVARQIDLAAAGPARARRRRVGRHAGAARRRPRVPREEGVAAAGAWSEREAALAICRLADADHAMKGGRRIDPELALERALADSL